MRKRTDGFTLVELMVVVLIIGVLVAVAVPVFKTAKAQAETNTCKANQRMILGAVQAWKATIGGGDGVDQAGLGYGNSAAVDPTDWTGRLIPNYIKSAPHCPTSTPAEYAEWGTSDPRHRRYLVSPSGTIIYYDHFSYIRSGGWWMESGHAL